MLEKHPPITTEIPVKVLDFLFKKIPCQSPEYEERLTESELHVRIFNVSHLHTGLYSCITNQVNPKLNPFQSGQS